MMPVLEASDRNIEWEIDPRELATIFAMKCWTYGTSQCAGVPVAEDIVSAVTGLADALDASGEEGDYIAGSRFLVYTDPEMPNSKDIYLYIGFMWEGDDDQLSLWEDDG